MKTEIKVNFGSLLADIVGLDKVKEDFKMEFTEHYPILVKTNPEILDLLLSGYSDGKYYIIKLDDRNKTIEGFLNREGYSFSVS